MNIAIIFAGGVGQRMHSGGIPKQFLELQGKPIIVYTIEHFQRCEDIDAIILISIETWIDYCNDLIKRYGLSKVVAVIPGGNTGFESIDNGILKAKEMYSNDSIVLIHDGVRPLIDQRTIKANIASVMKYGSSITVSSAIETILKQNSHDYVEEIIDRNICQIAKAPQSFYLKDIFEAHERAKLDGIVDFIDSASLMFHYGYSLHTVVGSADNIKITTPKDFYVFKAFVEARENSEIFGV